MRPNHELEEEMRRAVLCPDRIAAFRASREAIRRWERAHPPTLAETLARIDEIQLRFGAPRIDREPWRGTDFRL